MSSNSKVASVGHAMQAGNRAPADKRRVRTRKSKSIVRVVPPACRLGSLRS